jgi:uncharacterized membrane protein
MTRARIVSVLFRISVIAKGVDGALEVVGGALLVFLSPTRIHGIVRILTQHELSEDPRDVVARYLLHSTTHLEAGVKAFAAAYLLWHGLVKLVLIAGLLLERRWAYPAAISAFGAFLLYQLYRYSHTRSPGLLILSGLDVVVILLTWLEYRRLRATHAFRSTRPPHSIPG